MRRWALCAAGLLALPAGLALAQTPAAKSVVTTRVAMVSDATVCACDETVSPTPRLRDLMIVAVGRRFTLAAGRSRRWELAYVPELLPFVFSNRTADSRLEVWSCGARRYCGRNLDQDVWTVRAFGVGLLPVGLAGGVRVSDRVHLRARVAGGAVQLTEPVPLAQGTKFNFVADGSATAELRATAGVAFSVGMALNHISNGGLGRVNLGMDSRMLELGAVIGH